MGAVAVELGVVVLFIGLFSSCCLSIGVPRRWTLWGACVLAAVAGSLRAVQVQSAPLEVSYPEGAYGRPVGELDWSPGSVFIYEGRPDVDVRFPSGLSVRHSLGWVPPAYDFASVAALDEVRQTRRGEERLFSFRTGEIDFVHWLPFSAGSFVPEPSAGMMAVIVVVLLYFGFFRKGVGRDENHNAEA